MHTKDHRSSFVVAELGLGVDTLTPSVGVADADVGQPARRVLETALRLGRARTAVPAVDADARRTIADVEATAAVAVRVARVAKAHVIRQSRPRISPAHDRQLNTTTTVPTADTMRNPNITPNRLSVFTVFEQHISWRAVPLLKADS